MTGNVLSSLRQVLKKQDEFNRRIKHRHKIFWTPDDAEEIRNTPTNSGDSIEK